MKDLLQDDKSAIAIRVLTPAITCTSRSPVKSADHMAAAVPDGRRWSKTCGEEPFTRWLAYENMWTFMLLS